MPSKTFCDPNDLDIFLSSTSGGAGAAGDVPDDDSDGNPDGDADGVPDGGTDFGTNGVI